MNYYIQGNAANADQIKAAFEKLGTIVPIRRSCADDGLIYFLLDGEVFSITIKAIELFKKNPDYKELELPKPHYDIANFKPFDKVLVRDEDTDMWTASLYSNYDNFAKRHFVAIDSCYSQCIPYNNDTKHLLGTTDPCDECYINW